MSEHTGITFMCSKYKIQNSLQQPSLDIYLLIIIRKQQPCSYVSDSLHVHVLWVPVL